MPPLDHPPQTQGNPSDPVAASAPAHLLEFARGRWVALPPHTAIELIDGSTICDVPGAAYYCSQLAAWRGQWLPLLNLETLINGYPPEFPATMRFTLVVAYQRMRGAPIEHGAVALPATPRVIQVSDASQCALPTDSDLWPLLALSCFQHEGFPVPILDSARLFERYHG